MRVIDFLNPTLTWRSLAAGCFACCAAACLCIWLADPFGQREIRAKLRHGLSQDEVIKLLGKQPTHTYDRETAPDDYYVAGWSHKQRPITHRVLIFTLGQPICYVWLDENSIVEDYYVGGT